MTHAVIDELGLPDPWAGGEHPVPTATAVEPALGRFVIGDGRDTFQRARGLPPDDADGPSLATTAYGYPAAVPWLPAGHRLLTRIPAGWSLTVGELHDLGDDRLRATVALRNHADIELLALLAGFALRDGWRSLEIADGIVPLGEPDPAPEPHSRTARCNRCDRALASGYAAAVGYRAGGHHIRTRCACGGRLRWWTPEPVTASG